MIRKSSLAKGIFWTKISLQKFSEYISNFKHMNIGPTELQHSIILWIFGNGKLIDEDLDVHLFHNRKLNRNCIGCKDF